MGQTHLVLDGSWRQHFSRLQAAEGGAITVASMRRWIDLPEPMGLPTEAQDLIILTYAGQTNRTFFLRGIPFAPALGSLDDEAELREQALPSQAHWEPAVDRAAKLFGLVIPKLLNATNAAQLVLAIKGKAKDLRPAVEAFATGLATRQSAFGSPGTANRSVTAKASKTLLAALEAAADEAAITVLAEATLETSDTAMAQTISRAGDLDVLLRGDSWTVFEALRKLTDDRAGDAKAILGRLAEALGADEHVISLRPKISEEHRKAVDLLARSSAPPPPPPPGPKPPPPRRPGIRVIEEKTAADLAPKEACSLLIDLAERVEQEPKSRLNVSWTLVTDED